MKRGRRPDRLKKLLKTEEEVTALQLIEIYKFNDGETLLDSQYGKISYVPWLMLEATRINKDPSRTAAIVNRGKRFALFVNDVRQGEQGGEN